MSGGFSSNGARLFGRTPLAPWEPLVAVPTLLPLTHRNQPGQPPTSTSRTSARAALRPWRTCPPSSRPASLRRAPRPDHPFDATPLAHRRMIQRVLPQREGSASTLEPVRPVGWGGDAAQHRRDDAHQASTHRRRPGSSRAHAKDARHPTLATLDPLTRSFTARRRRNVNECRLHTLIAGSEAPRATTRAASSCSLTGVADTPAQAEGLPARGGCRSDRERTHERNSTWSER